VNAREAEELIREQLHDELSVAIRGLQVDIELGIEREAALVRKLASARERLARLAAARAEYANLTAAVSNHMRLLQAARNNLADARARQAGARSASVISRIDGVEAGVRPDGPGRKAITAAGGAAGLLLGIGCVFLFAPPANRTLGAQTHRQTAAANEVAKKGPANGWSHHREAFGRPGSIGRFYGMTLEQAIRSAEQRG
jgi:uncharacterized protein involved in exopolysaccharide biosynthesis